MSSTTLSPQEWVQPGEDAARRGSELPWARALGLLAVRRYALCAALVLALMAWNVFAGLGQVALNDSDEARYGVSAWEMLQSRSFVVTTYAGEREYWNLKPPLGYWLMALAFRLFGPTPFALRFPSALSALAVVAAMLWLGRRWLGRRQSLIAALIVATAYGFLSNHGARSGDLDAALTLVLLVATYQVSRLGESPWRVVALGAILGAGFLLKSFAILPTIAIAGLYALGTGAWRRQRLLPCLLALLAFALPVGAWALARCQADGSTYFLKRMVREDLLERSTQVIDKVTYSPFGYVAALFDRFAPWPLLLLLALAVVLRAAGALPRVRTFLRHDRHQLLLLWALVPLVLFSLSRTQHHWYLDPTYPAWAFLAALAVLALVRRARPERRAAVLVACLLVPLSLCEVRVLYRVLIAERMPEPQRFLTLLKEHRLELGPEIRTSPLRHSERFILEAMDGFEVREIEPQRTSKAVPVEALDPSSPSSVLVAKAARAPGLKPPLGSGIFLNTRDYLLFQGTSQLAGKSLPHGPRRRRMPISKRPAPGHLPPSWRPRARIAAT